MNDDTAYRIDLEVLITEREGMIAENQQRIRRGESLAYTEDAFNSLAQRIENLRRS